MSGLIDELRRYVESLEGARHAGGWDEPARLYRVHRDDDGMLASDEVRLELFHGDPVVSVQAMAHGFERMGEMPEPLRRAFQVKVSHPTIAYVTINEVWGRTFTPEEREQWLALPGAERPRFADMVGSTESRMAITIVGRKVLSYYRQRGEAPAWMDDRTVTDEVLEHERLTSALVRLTRADRLVVAR